MGIEDGRAARALGRHARRFALEELLGAGGFGSVYRAYDRALALEVALKIPHRFDPEGLLALKREFRVLAGIAHPSLLALHELFVGEASWFFTMDLVEGSDVLAFLGGRGLDRPDDRAAIAGLVDGLAALHAHGIVHRDLKPSNAWIDREGRAVLLDFGLAGLVGGDDGIAGTPLYLAPELLEGAPASPASDAYALGVILYEALSGERPFEGPTAQILARKLRDDAPRVRAASELAPLIDALLARAPAARPSLDALRARLGVDRPVEIAASTPRVIGRDAILARLSALAEPARAPRIVRLIGPPGIGKSAILGALERELAPRARVLRGRCSEHETVPFAMLDDAIDALVRALRADDALAASCRPELATIAEAFPAIALALDGEHVAPDPAAEPSARRQRVAHALRSVLDRLAADRPLAILLDDVHWADEDGAALLEAALVADGAHGFLVVLAQRDEDRDALARLEALGTIDLEVPPLAEPDARALAREIAGPARADAVAAAAAGSPFLVEALARADAIDAAPGEDASSLARRAITARIAALPRPARALLETSSIAGAPIALTTARAAAPDAERGSIDVGDLRRLESLRLVRARSHGRAVELSPYHDRVRELVVESLPRERRVRAHAALARALEAAGERDVMRLCMHYREAEELPRAASLAEVGADAALAQLAFARAAELYVFALAHRAPDGRERELRIRLGESLASSGRATDAADAFLAAIDGTDDADARIDLRRRAAEQLLRGGAFRRGVALLDEVLIEAGVPVRRSPARAMISLLSRRASLARKVLVDRPEPAVLDPVELRRIDACVSGAMGLSVVDSLRSADLMSEALSRALAHGDGRRLAVCTIWQTAFAANEGGPGEMRTRALLARGTTLVARHGGAYERGCVQAASALTDFHLGNFGAALGHTIAGERIFVEETRGTSKESSTMQVFSLAAQAMLGDLAGLSRRVPAMIHEAEARGDRYASTNLRQGLPMLRWLARDEPARAHDDLDRAMRGFDLGGYLVQHFMDLLGRVMTLLYEGRAAEARARYAADRARLALSLLSRTQWTRVHAGLLDAWTALALVPERRGLERMRLLWIARRRAGSIAREDRAWARAIAESLAAQIDRVEGAGPARLEASIGALDRTELGLYAALARISIGDARGLAWAEASGVARPERLARIAFPGVPLAISRSS